MGSLEGYVMYGVQEGGYIFEVVVVLEGGDGGFIGELKVVEDEP